MEAALASGATPGSSTELPAPAHEEESRHTYVVHPGSPKATSLSLPSPAVTIAVSECIVKENKSKYQVDAQLAETNGPRLRSSRMFKSADIGTLVTDRESRRPLRLLDLPVDVLKDIVKEVTHTNDLTSLALCHSALHRLTIPHIYSRFDIVWPDSSTHAEQRSGVDALTYGLATLVMAEEVFGEAPGQRAEATNRFSATGKGIATESAIKRRRGNHYAQFTKKFSLGNGPTDWVHEYLITKDSGKMLGTLVALAVAQMRALETFIWDMPTGILRDVWLALSSLADRDDGKECRLEKLWVRFHDNSGAEMANPDHPAPLNTGVVQEAMPHNVGFTPSARTYFLNRVERPTFSVLSPMKSLSVLDVDELGYLDEMSVLIGRSLTKLRELRVGIARQAVNETWVTVREGPLRQVDIHDPTTGLITIGEKRLGGVLGILFGLVHDMRRPVKIPLPPLPPQYGRTSEQDVETQRGTEDSATQGDVEASEVENAAADDAQSLREVSTDVPSTESEVPLSSLISAPIGPQSHVSDTHDNLQQNPSAESQAIPSSSSKLPVKWPTHYIFNDDAPQFCHTLQIENLELERVPIWVPVLQKSIDWTCLTSLTLLHCHNHELLWKILRRDFAPTPRLSSYPHARRRTGSSPKKASRPSNSSSELEMDYRLRLKKIHTNNVTAALISFLKETLAPDSLEELFLQDAANHSSSVSMQAIHRGALRRHRGSLKKLLIDSSERDLPDGIPPQPMKWRRWVPSRETLSFICGGKMPALRELGMALSYNDWHFFLQNLPYMPRLRSLYIPNLADHVHGVNLDSRELALQCVDIVALRPEVELCYMGIANKCFEILENRSDAEARSDSQLGHIPTSLDNEALHNGHDGAIHVTDAHVDEEDVDEEDGNEDDEDDQDETESDDDGEDDLTDSEGEDSEGKHGRARLRLREILFYDDKVAIFKARHGRL